MVLGITENGSYLTSAITDRIYVLIKESLFANNVDGQITLVNFLALKDELVFREVLNDELSKKLS